MHILQEETGGVGGGGDIAGRMGWLCLSCGPSACPRQTRGTALIVVGAAMASETRHMRSRKRECLVMTAKAAALDVSVGTGTRHADVV